MPSADTPCESGATTQALLVLADIRGGGPGAVRNHVATAHRRGLLAELSGGVALQLAPPLRAIRHDEEGLLHLMTFEALSGDVGRRVMQAILSAVQVFEARLQDHILANACPCSSCSSLGKLRLRLIVHAGNVHLHGNGRALEATGSAVALAYRLREGDAQRDTHLLITRAATNVLGLGDLEDFEPVEIVLGEGEVQGWMRTVERMSVNGHGAGNLARFSLVLKKAYWDFKYHGGTSEE